MHRGFLGPDKPAGTPADNLCLAGDSPPAGSGTLATEEWKIPLSAQALPPAQAHQLSSCRTWHALECLSTLFRKSRGTQPGKGKLLGQLALLKAHGLGKHSRVGVWCGLMSSSGHEHLLLSGLLSSRTELSALVLASLSPAESFPWYHLAGCKWPQHAGSHSPRGCCSILTGYMAWGWR